MIALLVGDNGSGKTWVINAIARQFWLRGDSVLDLPRSGLALAEHAALITFDRFGQDLHPKALDGVAAWMRGYADRIPVIAATVSPYAADCFAYGEVWVLHDRRAARLDQHPEVDCWRLQLQAGEFWVSTGEAWVAESPHAITLDQLVELLASRNRSASDPVTSA